MTRRREDPLRRVGPMRRGWARTRPEAADRNGHDDFRAHLLGRISWVAALHPARGARLRAAFDAVAWGD